MGSSNSKSKPSRRNAAAPVWRTMEGWPNNRMAIRIQSPNFDRIVLINKLVLIMRPAAWDENFDIWVMPTGAAAETYSEVQELLGSQPTSTVNFATNQEIAHHAPAKGVDRWRQVAKLLTMPVPWDGYRLPFGEFAYQKEQQVGYLFKGIFNKENKALSNGRRLDSRVFVEDCVLSVWQRYGDSQQMRDFVRCAAGEGCGYT